MTMLTGLQVLLLVGVLAAGWLQAWRNLRKAWAREAEWKRLLEEQQALTARWELIAQGFETAHKQTLGTVETWKETARRWESMATEWQDLAKKRVS